MSANKRWLDQLKVVSPCSTDWDQMSGDEKKRFCSECDKLVYDFSQMTRRQVEAIVSIHEGRMCVRLSRRPDGSLLTLEDPPIHPIVNRRASPVVNATLAAILGLSIPANILNVEVSAAQLIVHSDADSDLARTPDGSGEALVGGTVLNPQGTVMPKVVVKLISDHGAELKTKTSRKGEFTFAKVPFGAYILLVEANGFYTHVKSSVIVDTPHEMRFEVTMKVNQKADVTVGAMAIVAPTSLLDLYLHSDLIAIAHVGRSVDAGTDEKMNLKQIKTDLLISTQLKGRDSNQVISFYYWGWKSDPAQLKLGDRALVFLERDESEDGQRLGGYIGSGWRGQYIKKLDDESLAIYRQRIEELTAIFQHGNPDPAETVEWLIRCVEAPATREEGVSKLYEIMPLLQSQHKQRNEPVSLKRGAEESTDQSDDHENEEDSSAQKTDNKTSKLERERLKLAAALNQDHKTRLANALFTISELTEADTKLTNLVWELRDDRLGPYLVSQLRRVSESAPRFAESLAGAIAHIVGDDDIRRLAEDYNDAAEYDQSESDGERGQQDSTRTRRSGSVTVAAIKRSAMLKDFLKLVEYKTKR